MADLKMPEINHVVISGNLTRDPIFRKTPNGGSLVTFTIAANKRYRDGNNERKEEVYFIHIFALNRLAETCSQMLKKGYAVLLEGELISRKNSVNPIEVKARRIQFLTRTTGLKNGKKPEIDTKDENSPSNNEDHKPTSFEDDQIKKIISAEESKLFRRDSS